MQLRNVCGSVCVGVQMVMWMCESWWSANMCVDENASMPMSVQVCDVSLSYHYVKQNVSVEVCMQTCMLVINIHFGPCTKYRRCARQLCNVSHVNLHLHPHLVSSLLHQHLEKKFLLLCLCVCKFKMQECEAGMQVGLQVNCIIQVVDIAFACTWSVGGLWMRFKHPPFTWISHSEPFSYLSHIMCSMLINKVCRKCLLFHSMLCLCIGEGLCDEINFFRPSCIQLIHNLQKTKIH